MKRVKVYRKIREKNKILGLEFTDLLALSVVFLLVFLFSKNLILNIVIVAAAYLVLKFYKKGKPPHWTGSVLRFLFRKRRFGLRRELKKEIFK